MVRPWLGVPEDISEYQGFVYCITELSTGRYYVGQKKFWKTVKLDALKGRTKEEKLRRSKLKGRKRHVQKETDWREYYGSSEAFLALIEDKGVDNFERRVLYLCETKALMNLMELKEQMDRNVLFDAKSYNRIINVRINQNMISGRNLPEKVRF